MQQLIKCDAKSVFHAAVMCVDYGYEPAIACIVTVNVLCAANAKQMALPLCVSLRQGKAPASWTALKVRQTSSCSRAQDCKVCSECFCDHLLLWTFYVWRIDILCPWLLTC